MTSRASTAGERDVSARVDGKAVVLVLDVCARDVHSGGRADIESVGVVPTVLAIAGGVVDADVDNIHVLSTVNAETLDGGVEDIETGDGRVSETVEVAELSVSVDARAKRR